VPVAEYSWQQMKKARLMSAIGSDRLWLTLIMLMVDGEDKDIPARLSFKGKEEVLPRE
jgi:hypothetical protein